MTFLIESHWSISKKGIVMYMQHHSVISQPQSAFQSIKKSISKQISFWQWDRKLSKQYKGIMKNRRARTCTYDMNSGGF